MNAVLKKVLLGTSGWSYKEWIGPFYSRMDKSMLRAYAKIFRTAEINSTFYRYPSKGTVMGWARYSPEGFIYSAKLPRLITHDKKLCLDEDVQGDLERFTELMEPLMLSGKLGCILIQLPPKYNYNLDGLDNFLEILPTHIRFAIEFRNLSWMRDETWSLLKKHRVAYTIVDEPLLPAKIKITTDIAYFRWHGHGTRPWYDYQYTKEELEPWIPEVQKAADKVQTVYGYFNNHYHGYAVENCLQVMEMLGDINLKQVEAKNRVEEYLERSLKTTNSTLEAFVSTKKTSFEDLMRHFVQGKRLERAEQIGDHELDVISQSDDRIEASIRGYHIIVDSKTMMISHDCADWQKILHTKKLCKHVAKMLLVMHKERAFGLLEKLYKHKETWKFKTYPNE